MDDALLTQYTTMAIISWLTGIGVGFGSGILTALLIHNVLLRLPSLYGPLSLIPWRAIWAHFLLLFLLYPALQNAIISLLNVMASPLAFTLQDLGMGNNMLAASGGMTLLGWMMGFTTCLHRWHSLSLTVRILSNLRTLTVLAMILVLTIDFLSGEGVGAFIARRLNLLDFNVSLTTWWQFIGYTVLVDLGFGIAQMIAFHITHKSDTVVS